MNSINFTFEYLWQAVVYFYSYFKRAVNYSKPKYCNS